MVDSRVRLTISDEDVLPYMSYCVCFYVSAMCVIIHFVIYSSLFVICPFCYLYSDNFAYDDNFLVTLNTCGIRLFVFVSLPFSGCVIVALEVLSTFRSSGKSTC